MSEGRCPCPGRWTAQDSEGLFRCTVFSQLDLVSFCSAHNPDLLTETSLSGCKLHQIKRPNPYCKPRSCPTYITRESLAVASRGDRGGVHPSRPSRWPCVGGHCPGQVAETTSVRNFTKVGLGHKSSLAHVCVPCYETAEICTPMGT